MNVETKNNLDNLNKYTANASKELKVDISPNLLQFGLVHFLLYVAGIDKKIEKEEIEIIEFYTDYNIDKKKIKTVLELFKKEKLRIPLIFDYYIILNKVLEKQNQIAENLALALLGAFKIIGYEIVELHMNESLEVLNNFLSYEKVIKKYIITETNKIGKNDDINLLLKELNEKIKIINYNLKEYFNNIVIEEAQIDKSECKEEVYPKKMQEKECRDNKSKILDSNLKQTNSSDKKDESEHNENYVFEEQLEKIINELNGYIGLKKVKKEIDTLVNLIKVRKQREKLGLKNPEISYHLCFLGNPGTGKTTIARILAKIYKELGILRTGQLIEVGRQDLVGGYVGQTAIKTKEIIEKAYGGILFIDEAYSLSNKGSENDYGREAIEVILKEMEDHRDDLIVIVAGYDNEMKEFLKTNPGLESRFNTFIDFEDYSVDEMIKIFKMQCDKNDYVLDDSCNDYLVKNLAAIYDNRTEDFANARFIRNLFENTIKNQSVRLIKNKIIKKEEVQKILNEDIKF